MIRPKQSLASLAAARARRDDRRASAANDIPQLLPTIAFLAVLAIMDQQAVLVYELSTKEAPAVPPKLRSKIPPELVGYLARH